MEFIIGVFIGILVGVLFHHIFVTRKKPSGTFVMDFTDPMKDVCRIELDDNLNSLYSKKQIILQVKVVEDHSRN